MKIHLQFLFVTCYVVFGSLCTKFTSDDTKSYMYFKMIKQEKF